jgi:hypothetical protein
MPLLVVLAACGGSGDSPGRSEDPASAPPTRDAKASGSTDTPAASDPATTTADDGLGAPLDNPARYYGVYASAEQPNRQWFIAEAKRPIWAERAPEVPPGHLALGAMFGDVAPWHLRTVSETEFVQARVPDHQPEPVAVEFELDADGHAIAFRFTNDDYASYGRLERQGDLSDGWE